MLVSPAGLTDPMKLCWVMRPIARGNCDPPEPTPRDFKVFAHSSPPGIDHEPLPIVSHWSAERLSLYIRDVVQFSRHVCSWLNRRIGGYRRTLSGAHRRVARRTLMRST